MALGGGIEIDNVSVRYSEKGARVLKNINMKIKGGESVGIVGRTGSGKSSLFLALFRLLEGEGGGGGIMIDGIDVRSVGLRNLRSVLGIVAQDPVLFAGTLRYNLNPEGKEGISDEDMIEALTKAAPQLRGKGLDTHISEGGKNFSVGERQLISIARSMLKNAKIVALDEATAAIDEVTAKQLKKVVEAEMAGKTLLTIAHRLDTIMEADRVVVLDAGEVVEEGEPNVLRSMGGESVFGRLAIGLEATATATATATAKNDK